MWRPSVLPLQLPQILPEHRHQLLFFHYILPRRSRVHGFLLNFHCGKWGGRLFSSQIREIAPHPAPSSPLPFTGRQKSAKNGCSEMVGLLTKTETFPPTHSASLQRYTFAPPFPIRKKAGANSASPFSFIKFQLFRLGSAHWASIRASANRCRYRSITYLLSPSEIAVYWAASSLHAPQEIHSSEILYAIKETPPSFLSSLLYHVILKSNYFFVNSC